MFKNPASEFVYLRTYSRWIDSLSRREIWPETVDRFMKFITEERGDKIPDKVLRKIKEKILNFEVMPSMRTMWGAGDAAKADNTCMYNCSFLNIDSIESFSEAFYILMCGTGLGFSVEQSVIDKSLKEIPKINPDDRSTNIVEDSRKGWADSIFALITALYWGKDCDFDYSLVRPKGARLKTMGGRASGPAPLITLHSFIREVFYNAQGRKLKTLEVHDILNQIADSVVVGGVRRSSQISLSSLNDNDMRNAKIWPFPARRFMANNSAIYNEKPNAVEFLKEWSALASSGTGERGIFNLQSARLNAPKRRDSELIMGTNPCGEIVLRK
jgi:ribonucleoside-triphosphate reductase